MVHEVPCYQKTSKLTCAADNMFRHFQQHTGRQAGKQASGMNFQRRTCKSAMCTMSAPANAEATLPPQPGMEAAGSLCSNSSMRSRDRNSATPSGCRKQTQVITFCSVCWHTVCTRYQLSHELPKVKFLSETISQDEMADGKGSTLAMIESLMRGTYVRHEFELGARKHPVFAPLPDC